MHCSYFNFKFEDISYFIQELFEQWNQQWLSENLTKPLTS